ncbi:MAG TPA: hypothetical protein VI685_22945 [Candidatus Angelobacter sp.]
MNRKLQIAVFAACLLVASLASAQSSGYDVFQTGSGASVDLSSIGLGVVSLVGVPIGSSTGNADTIMYRPQAVPAGGGTIPVNLYALFLKSQNHVTYSGQSADVYVTVNNSGGAISTTVLPQPDSLSASSGTLTIYTNNTFDSTITINADVILVKAGGSPSDSSAVLGHQAAPAITLSQTGSSWSTTPPPGYPISETSTPTSATVAGPRGTAATTTISSGGIYFKPVHQGPHPVIPAQNSGGGCGPIPVNNTTPTSDAKGVKTSTPPANIQKCVN